ncbi:hypothetical protein H8356DRAFT_940445 [Neocallimastix lanati (nom. inval.)]|nr:hypothetical protein H8356DRAFT_940445 [Neocallimastix sp. JGI-2020a]
MGVFLIVIPVQVDARNPPISKKLQCRSTLCDPQGKAEPTIGHPLAIPEELETVILSDKA